MQWRLELNYFPNKGGYAKNIGEINLRFSFLLERKTCFEKNNMGNG